MRSIWGWLAGKKTYFVAGFTVLGAAAGYVTSTLDLTQTMALLSLAGGLVGIGDKLERHHAQTVCLLNDLASLTQAVASKDPKSAVSAVAKSAIDGADLASAVQADPK